MLLIVLGVVVFLLVTHPFWILAAACFIGTEMVKGPADPSLIYKCRKLNSGGF